MIDLKRLACGVLGLLAAGVGVAQTSEPPIHQYSIAAQDLATALQSFAFQSHREIFFAPELAQGQRSHAVTGKLDDIEALRVLLRDTGLTFSITASQAILVSGPAGPAKTPPTGGDLSKKDLEVGSLDQVTVTGSRLAKNDATSPQEVQVYSRERIDHSGQTTLADFFNTLPNVSSNVNENGFQSLAGATSVSLHGLPVGTTLVLLDGRRLEPSALQGSTGEGEFFDLNNVPLSAVERVEVVPEGSSAIYGSDAIAGVVNIILKKDLDGLETNVKLGEAADTHEWDADLAWGHHWDRGSLQVIANYNYRTPLLGFDRRATARSAYDDEGCGQADVFSINGQPLPGLGGATQAYVPAGFTGTASISTFAATAGSIARCQSYRYDDLIPQTKRAGVIINGTLQITSNVEAFGGMLYSHVSQRADYLPPGLYGLPAAGYTYFAVGANNPYNPFGVDVGASALYPSLGVSASRMTTEFIQPSVGFRGRFGSDWHWQTSVYESRDRQYYVYGRGYQINPEIQTALNSSDPATAFNPFTTGMPVSQSEASELYPDWGQTGTDGQTVVAEADAHGTAFRLPSGPVELALGTEYDRDRLYADIVNEVPYYAPNTTSTFHRTRYAFFAETRIPLLTAADGVEGRERLVVTLAARRDHYDDFGSKTTPQLGLAYRPITSLLLRGNYSRSFKAPSLFDLHGPEYVGANDNVADPLRGNATEIVTITTGSNPNLKAETGKSKSFGFVYTSEALRNLEIAVTHWDIQLNNAIQNFPVQIIVDNPDLFPNNVVRASSCSNGPPCPIVAINASTTNFGEIDVKGLDYRIAYRIDTAAGSISPSVNATQTYHFQTLLTPGAPAVQAAGIGQDDGIWAPRWRGNAMLTWARGPFSASATGRYVGHYRDYDSSNVIGNFWLFDANVRWALGETYFHDTAALRGTFAEIGGINLFNRQPQYSTYEEGIVGYDPTQSDIRQRFVYLRVGARL